MAEISKEYGTALFMLSCEQNRQTEFEKGLETLADAFRENPAYLTFLSSRSIPMKERLTAIKQAFSSRVPEEIVSYLQLLCEKGRIEFFHASALEFKKLLDASCKVQMAKITSAVPLTEDEKNRLRKKLEAMEDKTVNMEFFVDASILGGVIVEIGGKVLDGSLRNRLRDIKDVMNR